MNHVTALLIKSAMIFVVLAVILTGVYAVPISVTVILSVILVAGSYLLGDLGILRVTNNVIATAADLGLNAILIWVLGPVFGVRIPFTAALASAILISAGEWFFHKYVSNTILNEKERPQH